MFRKMMGIFAFMAIMMTPAYSDTEWGYDDYDLYEGGYYDTTTSDLYDFNDDWYYDSYTIEDAQQREEDAGAWDNSYGWEADDDLFLDDI